MTGRQKGERDGCEVKMGRAKTEKKETAEARGKRNRMTTTGTHELICNQPQSKTCAELLKPNQKILYETKTKLNSEGCLL